MRRPRWVSRLGGMCAAAVASPAGPGVTGPGSAAPESDSGRRKPHWAPTPAAGLLAAWGRDGAAGAGLWLTPRCACHERHLLRLGRLPCALSLPRKQAALPGPPGRVGCVTCFCGG